MDPRAVAEAIVQRAAVMVPRRVSVRKPSSVGMTEVMARDLTKTPPPLPSILTPLRRPFASRAALILGTAGVDALAAGWVWSARTRRGVAAALAGHAQANRAGEGGR